MQSFSTAHFSSLSKQASKLRTLLKETMTEEDCWLGKSDSCAQGGWGDSVMQPYCTGHSLGILQEMVNHKAFVGDKCQGLLPCSVSIAARPILQGLDLYHVGPARSIASIKFVALVCACGAILALLTPPHLLIPPLAYRTLQRRAQLLPCGAFIEPAPAQAP